MREDDDVKLALLLRDVADLKAENQKMRDEVEKLKQLDHNRMRAALIVLGGMVLSLISYIWTRMNGGAGGL